MCFSLIYRVIFSPLVWCPGSCPLWGGATTALEASVLALAAVLAWHHAQLACAGDTDDEYGWEHVDAGADRGVDDDDDEMKLAEI